MFTLRIVAILSAAVLLAACGGDNKIVVVEGMNGPMIRDEAPSSPNPIGLEFRPVDLGVPAPPDGLNHRTPEYMRNWGLDAIKADTAYQRGYFGQGATIAVADDGFDPTHPDLAGRIRAPRHLRNENADVFEPPGGYGAGHGTMVALVAAGARNNPGETFEITLRGGSPIPTKNVHGVAPEASVIPIMMAGGGHPEDAIRHAAANRAHVVNLSIGSPLSYYGKYEGRDGVWVTTALPYFRPLISLELDGWHSSFPGSFAEVARDVENSDIVMVWAAGNTGWNSINNELRMCGKNFRDEEGCELGEGPVSATEFMENFKWIYNPDNPDRTVSFKDMWGTDCGSENCIDYNSGGEWQLAPLFQPGLLGKWLVVAAMNDHGEIAPFSNGCGEARNWCLMAPGEFLAILPGDTISGTSFAAPMVSGALAALKSRLPGMPMEVVQAVLLASADPLGTRLANPREPDPVYGWGRLNLGNAITMQGSVHLPYSVAGAARSVPLRSARITLPPALAHVGQRMQSVDVAVGGVGSAYYNMKLSGIVAIETANPPPGRAAGGMLARTGGYRLENHGAFVELGPGAGELYAVGMDFSDNALGHWRLQHNLCAGCGKSAWREWGAFETADSVAAAPFFARPDDAVVLQMRGGGVRPFAAFSGGGADRAPWRQFGLSWRRALGGFDVVAEFSRIDESRSVWGAKFGALGNIRTRTLRKKLLLSTPLGANWRGFAGYEHNAGEVPVTGGMVSGVSGLRAEGWSMGTEGRHVFRDDDALLFSVHQKTGVRDGRIRISRLVATGSSFVDAFYRGRPQSLERRETAIDLRVRPALSYSLGYALPVQENTRLALGLEYESESANVGISAQVRTRF